MLIKCKCTTCSGNLEFESTALGHTIVCPHCGIETVLYRPNNQPTDSPAKPPPEKPAPVPIDHRPNLTGAEVILVLVSALVFVIALGLIVSGCAELGEAHPEAGAIRQVSYTMQYCTGFILVALLLIVCALHHIIRSKGHVVTKTTAP